MRHLEAFGAGKSSDLSAQPRREPGAGCATAHLITQACPTERRPCESRAVHQPVPGGRTRV